MLARELPAQILGDGGHLSRNPRVLVELLVDFLPTRQAFVARSIAAPEPLLNAIDRMTPMLRMFRHADGALAGFNGMGVSEPETLATLLAHGAAGAAAILDAPYSGYQRLEADGAIVIADVGAPPPAGVFAGGARGLSGVRILQRVAADRRQLRRAAARRRQGARGGAQPPPLIRRWSSMIIRAAASLPSGRGPSQPAWFSRARRASRSSANRPRLAARRSMRAMTAMRVATARFIGACFVLPPTAPDCGAKTAILPARKAAALPEKMLAVRFHLHPAVRAEMGGESGFYRLDVTIGRRMALRGDGKRDRSGGKHILRRAGRRPADDADRAADWRGRKRADPLVVPLFEAGGRGGRRLSEQSRRAASFVFRRSVIRRRNKM